jgi:hypothetical protein
MLHELELSGAIPIYMKNKNGTDGKRLRWSYGFTIIFNFVIFMGMMIGFAQVHILQFLVYSIFYFLN